MEVYYSIDTLLLSATIWVSNYEQVLCLESQEKKLSMLILFYFHRIKLFYEKTPKKYSLKIKKPDHRTVKSMAQLSSWYATITRQDFRVRAFRVICLICDNWSPSKEGSKRTKTNTDTRHVAENTANFSTQRLLKKWEAFPLMLLAHSIPELILLLSDSGSGLAIHAWW